MPKNGRVAEPGLSSVAPRERRDQNAACLGLPPSVDDRAATVTNHVIVPEPGLGIDRLADRAQRLQTGAGRFLDRLFAQTHQRANSRWRCVEDIDAVLVDHLPEARRIRIVGHAFEHQGDRAIGERSVNNVTVSGHPADIGGTPVDVAIVIIEDILMGHRSVDEIAASRVQDTPFGFPVEPDV